MHQFMLTFSLPNQHVDPSIYLDALFEAGCDDATIGVGHCGSIALEFYRKADTAEQAIQSAILDVCNTIPGAQCGKIEYRE